MTGPGDDRFEEGPPSDDGGSGDDGSPYEWLDAEWLPSTWVHPERMSPTRRVDRFRRTSAGMMLAGGMVAVQEILDPKKKEDPPIVVEAPGEPPGPRRVEADLDPDDPAGSSITIRRWVD